VQGFDDRWTGATIQIPTNMYHTSKVTTTRQAGETDGDFTLRHVAAYMLQMVGCPPVP
jgi:hypothetical protein